MENRPKGEDIPLKEILNMGVDDIREMPFKDFIGILTVMFEEIVGKKKSKPYKILSSWTKEYNKKRIFELLQYIIISGKPKKKPVGFIQEMLKDGFVESAEYREIITTPESIYGKKN